MQLFPQINTIISTSPFLINTKVVANSSKTTKLNSTNFLSFQKLNINKTYIPLASCVLEHILYSTEIPNLAKLTYILVDSLALKNHCQNGRQRAVDLSAEDWASRLNCSKTKIFATQKELEGKGYFVIKRSTNKDGRNQKNVITPTLPNQVFQALSQVPTRWNSDITWHNDIPHSIHTAEYKRFCLDNTKLFVPLNFPLLKLIAANGNLSIFAKVVLIAFLVSWHKYHILVKNNINQQDNSAHHSTDQPFVISYKELATKFNCGLRIISKVIVELEKLGFIRKQRFFVSNDDSEDNRHDKSLWSITISLPPSLMLELEKEPNRAKSAAGNTKKDEHYSYNKQSYPAPIDTATNDTVSFTINTKNLLLEPLSGTISPNRDPKIHQFGQYNNKEYVLNFNNTDNLDSEANFFKNSSNSKIPTKNLSELSVSYKNSFKKEKNEIPPTIACKTRIPNVELPGNSNLEKNKLHSDKTSRVSVKQPPTYQTETNKTSTLINVNTVSCPNHNMVRKTEIKIDKDTCRKIIKFSANSRLKDWYPLLPEDVGKLNFKAGREFSNNFVNELLLKLDSKYSGRIFPTKNHTLSYMAKALQRELHQAPLVNHETFRFAKNDQESIAERKREKHLSEVEASTDTSYESQLKRKIAATLEPKLAYQLLTKAKFTTTVQEKRSSDHYLDDQFDYQYGNNKSNSILLKEDVSLNRDFANQQTDTMQNVQDHSFTIKLIQDIQLSDQQQQALENAITAVYGSVDIIYHRISDSYTPASLVGKKYVAKTFNIGNLSVKEIQLAPAALTDMINIDDLDPNSSWYKIRNKLKSQLGEFIDKTWFSKLTAEENLAAKTLTLLAPSNLIRDYVGNKYKHLIMQQSKEFGYHVVELISKTQQKYVA